MDREPLKTLSHRQIADTLSLLDQHCIKNGEVGHCRYVGDWSDRKIAETVGCHLDQVARIRRVNGFGRVTKTEKPHGLNADEPTRRTVVKLVAVVADLLERLGDEKRAAEVRELLS